MKQLIPLARENGSCECSIPIILPGHILIKNHFSIISPGTEGSTVATARKGIIGKMQDISSRLSKLFKLFKNKDYLKH